MTPTDYIAIALGAIVALVLLAALIIALVKMTPDKTYGIINQILYALAIEAERLYGGKTGQIKKKQVIAWFYERYKWLSFFITESEVSEWIDEVVDSMNEWLQSNPVGAKNVIGETARTE